MRVLAIRGSNLASLGGPFTVDFTKAPLSTAGLFAISGPTGAGKSTLLDALCLALYDKTPRLAAANAVDVPDTEQESLRSDNPATLLRRGCAEAWAEVDFAGLDGESYRSRWSVRRARASAKGRIQPSDMALWRLSDMQRVGGDRKTEVKAELERLIGLDFNQFTRSVLLAQNEFSSFLKADERARAELLQNMTGDDRYDRISVGVYQRTLEEERSTEILRGRLAGLVPLGAEERAGIEASLEATNARLQAIDARLESLAQALAWCEAHDAVLSSRDDARARLQAAEEAREQAAPRRRTLALTESVQGMRGPFGHLRSLESEIKDLEAQRVRLAAEASDLDRRRRDSAGILARAEADRAAAEARRESDEPRWRDAAALDQKLEFKSGRMAEVERLLEDNRRKELARAMELSGLAGRRHQIQGEVARLGTLCERLAPVEAYVPEHSGTLSVLAEAGRTLSRVTQLQPMIREKEARLARASQEETEARAAYEREDARCRDLRARRESVRQALGSPGLREAEDRRASLEAEKPLLDRLRRLVDERTQAESEASAAELALANLRKDMERTQADRSQAENELAAVAASLQQARKSADLALVVQSRGAEELRKDLVDGSPCPVCGGLDHPWAHGVAAGIQTALVAERDSLQARHDAGQERLARLSGECEVAWREIERLVAQVDKLRTRLKEAAAQTVDLCGLLGLPPAWPGCGAHLAEREGRWAEARGQVDSRLREAQELRTGLDALDTELHAAEAALAAEARRTESLGREIGEASLVLENLLREAADCRVRAEARLAEAGQGLALLGAILPGGATTAQATGRWQESWLADQSGFVASLEALVKDWTEASAAREQANGSLQDLDAQSRESTQAMNGLKEARAPLQAERDGLGAEISDMRARRNALVPSDQSPAELKSRAEAERTTLQSLVDRARDDAREQGLACSRVEARLAQVLEVLEAKKARVLPLEETLRNFLASRSDSLDLEGLEEALGRSDAWLAQERAFLAGLDQDIEKARSVLDHLAAEESRLASSAWAGTRREDATLERETLRAEAADLGTQRGELVLSLRKDDEAQASAGQLSAELAVQEGVLERWKRLNSLVGSADGHKFRKYAQQMALDILVLHANHHLGDLARRYRLERLPRSLNLVMVDTDMADERRSVQSLSGGETFLVSLALALGLASLSSHRVRVESLFIDEGFGSLDADTLRVAMDALDRLKAFGRKVGVISHVSEMSERIGVCIRVTRQSHGRSVVETMG